MRFPSRHVDTIRWQSGLVNSPSTSWSCRLSTPPLRRSALVHDPWSSDSCHRGDKCAFSLPLSFLFQHLPPSRLSVLGTPATYATELSVVNLSLESIQSVLPSSSCRPPPPASKRKITHRTIKSISLLTSTDDYLTLRSKRNHYPTTTSPHSSHPRNYTQNTIVFIAHERRTWKDSVAPMRTYYPTTTSTHIFARTFRESSCSSLTGTQIPMDLGLKMRTHHPTTTFPHIFASLRPRSPSIDVS
ncbi:hypothetical protein HDK90DRAFT_554286, partial [Phyllosticta capitalensis]